MSSSTHQAKRCDETEDFKSSFHVVIVGAGLVGLGLAILLRKGGFKVTVLDKDLEMREIGAGVQLPANLNTVLVEMGLLAKIQSQSITPPNIILHSYDSGKVLTTLSLVPHVQDRYDVPHLVIHRADLRKTLADEAIARGAEIRLGSKISPENTDFAEAVIRLSDGKVIEADLLIGADGEYSVCREALLQRPDPPKPIGRLSNRIVIDAEAALKDPLIRELVAPPDIHTWLGPGCQAVCYLMHGAINLVMNRPMGDDEPIFYGPKPVDIEELRAFFKDWDPRIKALLEIAADFMKWISLETDILPQWVHPKGKFALIGDAAHATQPYLGQGAAIGMESASVLSHLLSRATSAAQIPSLLHLYNTTRLDRTTQVIRASKKMGDIWNMFSGPLQEERDRVLLHEHPGAGFPNMLGDPYFQPWLWGYKPKEEAETAWQKWRGTEE